MMSSLFLVSVLGACDGAVPDAETSARVPTASSPPADAEESSAAMADPLMPVAGMADAKCERKSDRLFSCIAGEYQIEITPRGCNADGFYGVVSSDTAPSVDLMDGLLSEQQVVARLPEGQFVCSVASARKPGEEASWSYVMAIPADSVPACKGKAVCAQNQGRRIEWIKPPTGTACRRQSTGYIGDCAEGWVRSEEFGEFSTGL